MIRVLIVEDGTRKLGKLFSMLDGCGIPRESVPVAQCVQEARSKLKVESFDLMILDVAIPLRLGDAPSEENALALLRDVVERGIYKRPGRIIGVTAFGDLAGKVAPDFAEHSWTLVLAHDTDDEWLRKLENCVKYLIAAENQANAHEYLTDLCIVCALADPELKALTALPWKWKAERPIDDVSFVTEGRFESGGEAYSVVAAAAPRMGTVATASLATKLIQIVRPRVLAMTGICAGYKQDCALGDVIFADVSWDYQSGKYWMKDGAVHFAAAPHHLDVPEFLRSRVEQLKRDGALWNQIREGWSAPYAQVPKLLIAPLASGAAVRADSGSVEALRNSQHRKLAGIDMETYGLYAAAANAGSKRPIAMALKAVSDFADEEKDEKYRSYASYTSARALGQFMERYMCELRPLIA